MPDIGYSARRIDLFTPSRGAQFFSGGKPPSEAALCAEMSRLAYCRAEPSLTFDRDRVLAVLKSIDFTGCDFFEQSGSHCILAHHSNDLHVLAFRGTDADDPTDMGYDADVVHSPWINGRVHAGFARGLMELQSELAKALSAIQGRVLFTGHSLGAAMATLFASLRKPDFLYTFGSPLVGDPDFVKSLDAVPSRRYVDCCDLVTQLPPGVLGYAHVGSPHYINSARGVTYNPDSRTIEDDQSQSRKQYLVEYAWRRGTVALRDLADHAPINYVLPIMAARE
jgi:hypothetical protein